MMDIKRIDIYDDKRFSEKALLQHGCFTVNDTDTYEIEIISDHEAVISGTNAAFYQPVIEEFRFYTPHICVFYDTNREIIKEYKKPLLFYIHLKDIQPSQFYVDIEKIDAVKSFIHNGGDIVIQAAKYGERYISLDGHTRLYYAVMQGYEEVRAVISETDDYIYDFAGEAIKRGISTPYDLIPVTHEEYKENWYQYCDDYFNAKNTG